MIKDGKLTCEGCGQEGGHGFEATATALVTVSLDASAGVQDHDNAHIQDEDGFREVRCQNPECEADLGDLSLEDLRSLDEARYGAEPRADG